MRSAFTERVIEAVRAIPAGRVATYGRIAALAGTPRAARQVARVLHSCSRAEGLPWHRVVDRMGRVALGAHQGGAEQRRLLEGEGVAFDIHPGGEDRIDLTRYLWRPGP